MVGWLAWLGWLAASLLERLLFWKKMANKRAAAAMAWERETHTHMWKIYPNGEEE